MKYSKLLIHLSLWTLYVLTYAILWRNPGFSFGESLVYEIAQLPFKLLLVYTAIFFITPRFLFKEEYLKFFFCIALVSFGYGILHQLYMFYIVEPMFAIKTSKTLWDWDRITKRITFLNTPMLIAVSLVVLNNYYVQKNLNVKISNEKLTAELKLLRNQLQPHFFFNTLNTLYSLSLQKSELAPGMILKLSDLMRYTLDQAENDKVSLQREIDFVKNYVAIEEMRFHEKAKVNWDIKTGEKNYFIPPLILPTFIENVFKHAVVKSRETIVICIKLWMEDGKLHYAVENDLPFSGKQVVGKKGLGLDNLRQRLELIYKSNFILEVTQNSKFKAYLSIPVEYETT